MNPLHDSNPTTYVAYYKDGSVKVACPILEAVELFDGERTGVQSIAPTAYPYKAP